MNPRNDTRHREKARAAAFTRALNARSVAVVGASANPQKLGHRTLRTILSGGFTGDVYPVNPGATEILGFPCFPSIEALPDGVPLDLAVIVVPARRVPPVIKEAGRRGAAAALVISGGFRESGDAELEKELLMAAREPELLVIGPNVQGLAYVPNALSALMYPALTVAGPLAVIGQSGSITAAIAEWAERDGLGASAIINLGNKADVDETDVLEWLSQDPPTRAFALYLEGVQDGRRFMACAQKVSEDKPIVVLKSGRSPAGQRAVASHTASLAGSDQVFSAACEQFDILRANDMIELYDAAKAFALIREPPGRRLLSISSSGGAGALAIDEATRLGLQPADLPSTYLDEVRKLGLSAQASCANPFDTASLEADQIGACARLAAEMNLADVILFAFGDPVPGGFEMVKEFAEAHECQPLVTYLGGGTTELADVPRFHRAGIPCYPSPEQAIRSLAAVVSRFERRSARGSES